MLYVGLRSVPAIVCDLSRDEAAVLLVESNLHREHLLPSEKAFAYKMKLDALKHQGKRMEDTSCQVGTKLRSDEELARDSGESARTVQRYIRLSTDADIPFTTFLRDWLKMMRPSIEDVTYGSYQKVICNKIIYFFRNTS